MSRGASEARAGFVVPEAGKIWRGVVSAVAVGGDEADDGEKGHKGEEGTHDIVVG